MFSVLSLTLSVIPTSLPLLAWLLANQRQIDASPDCSITDDGQVHITHAIEYCVGVRNLLTLPQRGLITFNDGAVGDLRLAFGQYSHTCHKGDRNDTATVADDDRTFASPLPVVMIP